jgi:DNA-directed RNA polymerase sigma subunit (sigma70/sigma32)
MEQIKKLNYNTRVLTQLYGKKPTTIKLAEVMEMPESKIHQLQGYISREPVSLDNINQEKFMEEKEE